MIGMIFCTFPASQLLANIGFMGRYGDRFSDRTLLFFGFVVQSVPNFALILVFKHLNGTPFVGACCFLRVFEGLGGGVANIAAWAAITKQREGSEMGMLAGMMEAAFWLGFICGPLLSGWVMTLGDVRWTVPIVLLFIGVICLLAAFTLILPNPVIANTVIEASEESSGLLSEPHEPTDEATATELLCNVRAGFTLFTVMTAIQSICLFNSTLGTHFHNHDGNEFQVGEALAGGGAAFIVTSLVIGNMSDRLQKTWPHFPKLIMYAGILVAGLGLLIAGPSPLFCNCTSLASTRVGVAVTFMGSAIAVVPGISVLLSDVAQKHCSNKERILVSAQSAVCATGECVGVFFGAFMIGAVDFQAMTSSFALVCFILVILAPILARVPPGNLRCGVEEEDSHVPSGIEVEDATM